MFCEQCGTKFGVDAKFCGGCGAPRKSVDQNPSETVAEQSKGEAKSVTPFDTKVKILAALWVTFGEEPDWQDFISQEDLGLPLAFMIANAWVDKKAVLGKSGEDLIHETFENLLTGLDIEVDTGFENLDQIVLDESA
jgi:hypothetical protein